MTTVIEQIHHPRYSLYNGDCVEVMASLPDNSIDFSVYSPPFSNLYIYSDSERDMGNCKDDAEFFMHYEFAIREKYRITRPGRLTAVHCKQVVNYKGRDGASGWRDFRGDIIRAHQKLGWVYHCEIVIWKCPVTERARTNCQRLLYKQLREDSSLSGVGIPEYLILFRKWPSDDSESEMHVPVRKTKDEFPLEKWQKWASPVWDVWFDIDQMDVLNTQQAKSDKDQKHICPLQLQVINRAVTMWTNPGEVVLSPFGGIGSEPYESLKLGRKAIAVELKPEYFNVMSRNCKDALREEQDMFPEHAFNMETAT